MSRWRDCLHGLAARQNNWVLALIETGLSGVSPAVTVGLIHTLRPKPSLEECLPQVYEERLTRTQKTSCPAELSSASVVIERLISLRRGVGKTRSKA